jgi:pimeloyl-ACP methyl ester carboxylesterase
MIKKVLFKKAPIYYSITGEGPAVILLHGFLENKTMWHNYAQKIAKTHKVICPDLPGHGQSANLGYVHSMNLMAESVMAILKKEKLRKVILVGHSMGGYVVMAFADLYPDYLKGLCLFQSTSNADSALKKKGRDQAIKLVKQNHKSFVRKTLPMLFRHKYRAIYREKINQLKTEALTMSKQGIVAALEGMKTRPNREIILKFPPCEVYLIGGKHDRLITPELLEKQSKHSPKVRLKILEEAGHMAYIEQEEKAYTALYNWIKFL